MKQIEVITSNLNQHIGVFHCVVQSALAADVSAKRPDDLQLITVRVCVLVRTVYSWPDVLINIRLTEISLPRCSRCPPNTPPSPRPPVQIISA